MFTASLILFTAADIEINIYVDMYIYIYYGDVYVCIYIYIFARHCVLVYEGTTERDGQQHKKARLQEQRSWCVSMCFKIAKPRSACTGPCLFDSNPTRMESLPNKQEVHNSHRGRSQKASIRWGAMALGNHGVSEDTNIGCDSQAPCFFS